MAVIKSIGEIRKTMTFVTDFRSRMSYLTQAKQYMTDEQAKQKRIEAFIYNLERLFGMEAGSMQAVILPIFAGV